MIRADSVPVGRMTTHCWLDVRHRTTQVSYFVRSALPAGTGQALSRKHQPKTIQKHHK